MADIRISPPVTLTGSETLTNKTLTSPVVNTKITGTALNATLLQNYAQNGDFENWSAGASAAPDEWSAASGITTIAQDGTNKVHGSYGVSLLITLNSEGTFRHTLTTTNYDLVGRQVTAGAWINASVASRVYLKLLDSAGNNLSSAHSGGGGWEYLTVTRTINSGATYILIDIVCTTGAVTTVYVDGVSLVKGASALEFFDTPKGQYLYEVDTLTAAKADGDSAGLNLDPRYYAASAQTLTRHNYVNCQNPTVTNVTITDAAALRFDAATGTHKATASNGVVNCDFGTLGPTGAGTIPSGWMKINVNGAIKYIPYF